MTVARFVESNDGSALALATVIIDLSPASRLMALDDTADTAAGAESETTTDTKSTSVPRASAKLKFLMAEWYQMRLLSVNPVSPRTKDSKFGEGRALPDVRTHFRHRLRRWNAAVCQRDLL